jgi:hypothetical protein
VAGWPRRAHDAGVTVVTQIADPSTARRAVDATELTREFDVAAGASLSGRRSWLWVCATARWTC